MALACPGPLLATRLRTGNTKFQFLETSKLNFSHMFKLDKTVFKAKMSTQCLTIRIAESIVWWRVAQMAAEALVCARKQAATVVVPVWLWNSKHERRLTIDYLNQTKSCHLFPHRCQVGFVELFHTSDELANRSHLDENLCRLERLNALLCSRISPTGHFHCSAVNWFSKRDPE